MNEITYMNFAGEQPKVEPHLLPPTSAQLALNCEFASGSLVPSLGGTLHATLLSNPIKGLYTKTGATFYSWTAEAQTFSSPVIDDTHGRMYFLLPSTGVFNAALESGMAANGPTPAGADTFKVGVPQPTVAPVLTLVQRTDLPEYPGATLTATTWWESAAVRYGEVDAVLTVVLPYLAYTFPLPAQPSGTPAGATLGAKVLIKDSSGVVLVSATVRSGTATTSKGLPGGIEVSLANDGAGKLLLLWGITETRAYTYTNENTWNEEGAAAPPATISPNYLQDVQVVVAASTFTGFRPFLQYNVYHTYSDDTYIKTATGPADLTNVTRTDASRKPDSLGYALESLDWFPPPDGLEGMVLVANGWFAAFKGNNLHLSEPYKPHAWPYVQKFPHAIRGIHPMAGALVVTTTSGVFLLNGSYPLGTGQMELPLPQPGISQRSMTGIDGAVAYASNDGFAFVSGTGATMKVSQKLFTRKTWRALYGDMLGDGSMRFAYHDGSLIATSSVTALAGKSQGFILRLDEDMGSYTRMNVRMDGTFMLPVNDALYYSIGTALYSFQTGADQTFDWWGKDFVFPKPASFGAGFIRSTGAVTITLYANGTQVYTASINNGYFRIPDINNALRWSVRLTGSNTVRELVLARTLKDLKGV